MKNIFKNEQKVGIHSCKKEQIQECKVKSMDDNCGEWVECMGVASRSGWNLWVWLAGGECV